jgi:hypothetical protein
MIPTPSNPQEIKIHQKSKERKTGKKKTQNQVVCESKTRISEE